MNRRVFTEYTSGEEKKVRTVESQPEILTLPKPSRNSRPIMAKKWRLLSRAEAGGERCGHGTLLKAFYMRNDNEQPPDKHSKGGCSPFQQPGNVTSKAPRPHRARSGWSGLRLTNPGSNSHPTSTNTTRTLSSPHIFWCPDMRTLTLLCAKPQCHVMDPQRLDPSACPSPAVENPMHLCKMRLKTIRRTPIWRAI
ncbi:hypothetical protein BDU57DRAFT_170645 [Ampelomyces quisqualis]|uniref:Uncharacterized protein n=1 Tax=Ampelomyces quisqualis TaxID=50730 RepID=A0A6A5QPF1_AMPQU|nr:hypothetical protein BDU57DRAFT_170645 [Ampelomyces quisqualis]